MLAAAGALWLSLLTWTSTDPSLSTTSSNGPANLLGYFGAVLSDLLLQIFGLGSVVLLSCLMIWSFRLVVRRPISHLRIRCLMMLLSVFALAGSLSSLPVSSDWSFLYGYGGIIGDLSYNITSSIFTFLLGQFGGVLAGLILFALSYLCFTHAIDITHQHFLAGCYAKIRSCFYSENGAEVHKAKAGAKPQQIMRPQFDFSNLNPAQAHLVEFGRVGSADAAPAEHSKAAPGPSDIASPDTDENDGTSHNPHVRIDNGDLCARKMAKRFAPRGRGAHWQDDAGKIDPHGPKLQRETGDYPAIAPLPTPVHQQTVRSTGPSVHTGAHTGYRQPSLDKLQSPTHNGEIISDDDASELSQTAEALSKVLTDFRVKAEIRDIRRGPIVTLFEFEPAPGTKASRIISLADDIARSMSAESARIAVIPGRNAIGIELPNAVRERVLLRDILENEAYRDCDARLPLALGKSIDSQPVIADLTRMPHLLVAGTTGSGKSVGINAMILSLLYRKSPQDCRLLMIDPKMLELSAYNGIPHLLSPVITDPHHAALALEWAVRQMENRYKQMTEMGARSIEVFNNRARHAQQTGAPLVQRVHVGFDPDTGAAQFQDKILNFEPMPYIVIIVDEFADLMAVAGKEIDILVKRLAQMARAAGIHLIMATQRPSVDVVTGTIKANFPTRIAYKVASKIDSRTIVNCAGAEQLLGQGDLLLANGSSSMVRAHGPFVSDDEVEAVAHALKVQGEPNYAADLTALFEGPHSSTAQTGSGQARSLSEQKVLNSDSAADADDRNSVKIVA